MANLGWFINDWFLDNWFLDRWFYTDRALIPETLEADVFFVETLENEVF